MKMSKCGCRCKNANCDVCCGGNKGSSSFLKFSGQVLGTLPISYAADAGNQTTQITPITYPAAESFKATKLTVNVLTALPAARSLTFNFLKNGVVVGTLAYAATESGVKSVVLNTTYPANSTFDLQVVANDVFDTAVGFSALVAIRRSN